MLRVCLACNFPLICRQFSCKASLKVVAAEAAPALPNINSTAFYINHEPKADDTGNKQSIDSRG